MKRREFIGMAAFGAAGAVLPLAARGDDPVATMLARPRLLELFEDASLVRALGERYRESAPAENAPELLVRALLDELPDHPRQKGDHLASQLHRQIDARVQRDFAEGRTVTLQGWILSVTEARQCALFSHLSS